MSKLFYSFCFAALISFSALGCSDGASVPKDAPPTPEAGTTEYDSYNNAGKKGPADSASAPAKKKKEK